ncbi:helix-turn-helix domain-containing protein [Thiolapillus sp.]|uniref:helix-turn-helix domain-containing protein n=1 Tax=Thiolapillus sp. TaxID=2017437 RepID=UPI0025F1DE5B
MRELENVLPQALVQAREGAITADLIRFHAPQDTVSSPSPAEDEDTLLTLEEVEARHIQKVLWHTGGHKGNTCQILGISRPALDRKTKKYGLQV